MKLLRTFVIGALFGLISVAESAVTVKFSFDVVSAEHLTDVGAKGVTGDRLYVNATLDGIAPGQKFEYYFRWTSPSDSFESSEYPSAEDRASGKKNLYAGDDACDAPEARCQCYCKYVGAEAVKAGVEDGTIVRGCWRTNAYRTIEWTGKSKIHVAAGSWTVELVYADSGEAIGSAEYVVE